MVVKEGCSLLLTTFSLCFDQLEENIQEVSREHNKKQHCAF